MNKPTTFPTPHLSASEAEGRAPVPVADRDYADWYEIGEAWVRANSPASRGDGFIRQLVHGWMQIHCPARLLAEHRAAVKAAIHAEFGAPAFKVTQYGIERVPA